VTLTDGVLPGGSNTSTAELLLEFVEISAGFVSGFSRCRTSEDVQGAET